MESVRLGASGLKVSRLCLGTMTFGLQTDEQGATAILDKAFDGGVYFLDTADVYPLGGGLERAGRTEEIIGRWLRGRRDRVVLATKGYGQMGPMPFDVGNSRKHLTSALEASLRRLGTDYVDLYQLHRFDSGTPLEETMETLDDFVRSGKVRYVGCSNFAAYRLAKANGIAERYGWTRFVSVQPRYNLLFRVIERDLLPLAREDRIGVIPYNPIAGGLLSGKHDPHAGPTEGTRFNSSPASELYRQRYWHERMFATVEEFLKIAAREGVHPVTLAVAWVMQQPGVTSPIIGASRADQLDASLAALEYVPAPELVSELDALTVGYREGIDLT